MIQLFHDDCLNKMKDIEDECIDLILCDLPYGTTACKWDSIIPLNKMWEQYNRLIKSNGTIVLFSVQPFTTTLIYSNLKNYKYNWYWVKNTASGFSFAKYQPMRKVEDICVFYKKHGVYNPQGLKELDKPKTSRRKKLADDVYGTGLNKTYVSKYTNYPNNILNFKNEFGLHPTQKPVSLLEYLIKTYTNENEIVLDNCMGSGSTGVAAVNTNRKFIGIEKNEKYFNVAKERIEQCIAC